MRATLITIGDEILNGQTQDTNSSTIARMLSKIGVVVEEFRSVKDHIEPIRRAISDSLSYSDIVITTGGLGPTKDDRTREALCDLFEVKLIQNIEVKENVKRLLSKNVASLKLNYKQSLIPSNAIPLMNYKGTAPGLKFNIKNKLLFVLPGVPFEMAYLTETYILPELKRLVSNDKLDYRYVYVYNFPESILSKKIEGFENSLDKNSTLSYLPDLNLVKLRLSFANKTYDEVERIYKNLLNAIPKETFYTLGDFSLAKQLGNKLQLNSLSLGIAESCTGGFLSHLITSEAGSSHYFMGSLVSYAYDVKSTLLKVDKNQMIRDGAVSEETVHQMAKEVNNLLATQCGIAISGIAGPDGGTEDKPVGTVWIATNYKGKILSKRYQFNGDRAQVILRSARNGMIQLMQMLPT